MRGLFYSRHHAASRAYPVLAEASLSYPGFGGWLSMRYSPFRHSPPSRWVVRLACLIHAATVRSEPGSNPSVEKFNTGKIIQSQALFHTRSNRSWVVCCVGSNRCRSLPCPNRADRKSSTHARRRPPGSIPPTHQTIEFSKIVSPNRGVV